jgi:hypothetical protein
MALFRKGGQPNVPVEPLARVLGDSVTVAPGTSTALPEIGPEFLPTDFVAVADDAGPGGAPFDEAIAAWNRRDMGRSAQLFTEAIEAGLDPTFVCGAEASLGQIRLDEGDLKGGVEHLLRCLGTRPITAGQAWEAAVRLQVIYDTAGRRDEARRLADVAANANRRGLALRDAVEDRLRHLASALQVPAGATARSPAEAECDVPELIGSLRAADPKVRTSAVKALGATGDQRAIQPLISALADDDWDVSCQASLALPQLGEAAVAPVIAALTDQRSGVPANAFRALGVEEDDVAKLSDDDPDVRRAAEELFRALAGFPSNP